MARKLLRESFLRAPIKGGYPKERNALALMNLDSFNTWASLCELRLLLSDSRLQKISQLSELDFLFHLRSPGRTDKLFLSLHPQRSRFHVIEGKNPSAIVPSSFLMLCRKHIQGTGLIEIQQGQADRVVELSFSSGFSFVFDWTGKPSAALLIKTDSRMVVGAFPPRGRFQLRRPYQAAETELPPAPLLSPALALCACQELESGPLSSRLLPQMSSGWSPLWSKRFERELQGGDPEPSNEDKFLQVWDKFFTPLVTGELNPGLGEDGELTYLEPVTSFPTMQAAASARWQESTQAPGATDHRTELLKTLRKGQRKAARKLEKREKDRQGAESAPRDQMYGDILLANAWQLKNRRKVFDTQDWEGRPLSIQLKPELTPTENAEVFYKRSKKKKRALKILSEQIALAREELSFWDELLLSAENALDRTDLEEIRKAIPTPRQRKRPKVPQAPTSGPRRYEIHGFQILVGRNPTQNEKLSLRTAAKDDHWFHIESGAGSHVILKASSTVPTAEVEYAAAWLAAYFSRSKNDPAASVLTTRARFLKRPKHGPPGKVLYRQEKQLIVDPTATPPEGLKATDQKDELA